MKRNSKLFSFPLPAFLYIARNYSMTPHEILKGKKSIPLLSGSIWKYELKCCLQSTDRLPQKNMESFIWYKNTLRYFNTHTSSKITKLKIIFQEIYRSLFSLCLSQLSGNICQTSHSLFRFCLRNFCLLFFKKKSISKLQSQQTSKQSYMSY